MPVNERSEREAVIALADYADTWAQAPMNEIPAVVAVVDQFGAGALEGMRLSG